MSAERQQLSTKIERLVRHNALRADHMMHLFGLFAEEENVKITRQSSRRLLRLEKYSDDTIKKVKTFLDSLEKKSAEGGGSGLAAGSFQQPQLHHPHQPNKFQREDTTSAGSPEKRESDEEIQQREREEMAQRKLNRLKARSKGADALAAATNLPSASASEIDEESASDNPSVSASSSSLMLLDESAMLKNWLSEQSKRGRRARNTAAEVYAPQGMTALPVTVRVVTEKKKRRRATRTRKTRKKAEGDTAAKEKEEAIIPEEEEDEEDEEEEAGSDEDEIVVMQQPDEEGDSHSVRDIEGLAGGVDPEADEDEDEEEIELEALDSDELDPDDEDDEDDALDDDVADDVEVEEEDDDGGGRGDEEEDDE